MRIAFVVFAIFVTIAATWVAFQMTANLSVDLAVPIAGIVFALLILSLNKSRYSR